MLAVFCALASSLMYAVASVLQQRSASAQPEQHALKLGLLVRLIRSRAWLVGIVCDAAGYVLQFVALGHGPIVLVQPLLVCGILFALPLGAAWAGHVLRARDWFFAVLTCAGLAVFLTVANPASGHNNVRPAVWVLLLSSAGVVALALIALTRGPYRRPRQRALLLSAAAGVLYGVTAALTKTCSHLLEKRLWHVLLHWQPYALVAVGVVGMIVAQSAFQAGALDVSLPAMSVVDPVVSIAIGAFAFGESLAVNSLATTVEVLALIGMSVGVVLLARAEAVEVGATT